MSSPADDNPGWSPAPSATGSSLCILALCLCVALTFADLVAADSVPSRRDLLPFFLPFKIFLAEGLRNGDVPLWNPWTFLGTPFLATLQTGVLYPPSALLLLPFPLGLNVFILFHYFLALGGAWCLFRDRALGRFATSIGALTFVVGGYLVSLLNVTNHLQSAAWSPLALFLWSRYRKASSHTAAGSLTAVLAVQILGGSPETVIMTGTILAGWSVSTGPAEIRRLSRTALTLAGIVGVAICLTAFQLLPTVELTRHSVRGSAFNFGQVSFWSLEPVALLQLLFPHSSSLLAQGEQNTIGQVLETQVPWLSSVYLGLVPLCFMIVGMVRGRERYFWSGVAVVGVLLALGEHGPLLARLYDLLPGIFGKFRYPEKFWFLTHFAAAILCAEGAERVSRGDRSARRLAAVAALTFLGIALLVIGVRWIKPAALLQLMAYLGGRDFPLLDFGKLGADFYFKALRLTVILGAFLVLLLAERVKLIRGALTSTAIVALVAADLGGAHYNLNFSISWSGLMNRHPPLDVASLAERHLRVFNYQTTSSPRRGTGGEPIVGLEEGFKVLRNTDDVRAFALDEWPSLPGNVGLLYGVGTVTGAEAIDRGEIETLRDVLAIVPRERAVHLLRLYSVGALIGSAPLDLTSLRPVAADGSRFAYEVRKPLPRAYLAFRLKPARGLIAALNAMIEPAFEPGVDAVVEGLPEEWRDGENGPSGEVEIVRYENDGVQLRVRTPRRSLLVLNDSWFPGWEAVLDGAPTVILRTNGLVRGVVVPRGEHEVRFAYRPLSVQIGAAISIITGILLIAWIVLRSLRLDGRRPR